MPSNQQNLPDLAAYRAEFARAGVTVPLPLVPTRPEGLLGELPPPPPDRHGWPWDVQTAPPNGPGGDWPLVTVVTPSYQQADYLEETLRATLLQNYPRFELIVLDGGSTDGSAEIIERYRPWLSFGRVARDRGQSHAINQGFSLGSGALFGWINSDDFYLPGTLARVAEAWRRGAEFSYGDILELDEASGRLSHAFSNLAHRRYVKFAGLVPQPGTFWAAARHQPLWEEQHCALDYELWIRLLPGLRLRHLGRPLAVARQHGAAKTYDPAMKKRWDEDAARNGRAHPEIYRPGWRSRWLDREFRLVQRLWRAWHGRGLPQRLEDVQRETGWAQAPNPGELIRP
jgi:glycosyltransferase involved in cell wall biosynthesis